MEKKTNPIWIHIGVLIVMLLGGLYSPILFTWYITGATMYHIFKWSFSVLISGSGNRWFYLARRLFTVTIVAIVLGFACGFLYTIHRDESQSTNNSEISFIGVAFYSCLFLMGLIPVLFCASYLLSIPVAIIKWMSSVSEKRKRDRESEASRRESERQSQLRSEENLQKRGDDAKRAEVRAKCELHYELHAPEVADRFPRARFDAFMKTYLSDSHDVSYVVARGKELIGLIESHRRAIVPDVKPQTIADISKWYLGQKQEIESLPLDEDLKHEHIVALDRRYAEITQNFLEKMGPS